MVSKVVSTKELNEQILRATGLTEKELTSAKLRQKHPSLDNVYRLTKKTKDTTIFIDFYKKVRKSQVEVDIRAKMLEDQKMDIRIKASKNLQIKTKIFGENEGFIVSGIYDGKEYRAYTRDESDCRNALLNQIVKENINSEIRCTDKDSVYSLSAAEAIERL